MLLAMPTFSFAFDEPKHNYGLWESKKRLSLDDYLDLESLVFKWADSYDAKVTFRHWVS